jgi:predicted nucleotidyltransferase
MLRCEARNPRVALLLAGRGADSDSSCWESWRFTSRHLHIQTGEAITRDGDYFGRDVNKAAWIMDADNAFHHPVCGTWQHARVTSPTDSSVHDPLEGVTADGMIATGAHPDRIPNAYRDIIEDAIDAVASGGGGAEASLYLYGSVATGTAVVPSSDVDLFTIGLPSVVAGRIGARLTERHRETTRAVQVGAAQHSDYEGDGWEARGNRIFLRHYCVHLTGPDPQAELPAHPADAAAARGFNGDIAIYAAQWEAALVDRADTASLARRIGRKSLFAVAGLVSVHDDTWTTDRHLAAQRWAEIEPGLADGLRMLLRWGDGTEIPGPDDIGNALDGVVAPVVRAFDQRIGLW